MFRTSIPVGRYLGVDVRVNILLFPILPALAIIWSMLYDHSLLRGMALWFCLCLAVLVREAARAIAATYVGLNLLGLYLMPVGGVMAFAPRQRSHDEKKPGAHKGKLDTRAIAAAGPLANLFLAVLLGAAAWAIDPSVGLFAQPWLGPSHILRSLIWTQVLLALVSLIPASAMSARQLVRSNKPAATPAQPAAPGATIPALNFMFLLGIATILAGLYLKQLWLILLGAFQLLYSQMTAQTMSSPEAENIFVREVMLTEYTLLSTTDTLRDALSRTVHSTQDVFPVVRGRQLVGSVARQTIAERLLTEGDSYLQGVMTRSLQTAEPNEKLVDALRRAGAAGASEFIPVVEDDAVVALLTPASLNRAVQQLQLTRPAPATQESR